MTKSVSARLLIFFGLVLQSALSGCLDKTTTPEQAERTASRQDEPTGLMGMPPPRCSLMTDDELTSPANQTFRTDQGHLQGFEMDVQDSREQNQGGTVLEVKANVHYSSNLSAPDMQEVFTGRSRAHNETHYVFQDVKSNNVSVELTGSHVLVFGLGCFPAPRDLAPSLGALNFTMAYVISIVSDELSRSPDANIVVFIDAISSFEL